ncbi:hypothetical protein BDV25DRAFT_149781 [Aspergillus avenaceus]|uniref:Extracellular membrane protein CFEM domain-containing protein n=1 Tax=Aspergillus avenaceus TaxID=36643 RepID=A0A5N6U3Y6_ASPAV|nr:hypothetical protein BDV25DRAFT_149781 [Aspergillus avenaceus]
MLSYTIILASLFASSMAQFPACGGLGSLCKSTFRFGHTPNMICGCPEDSFCQDQITVGDNFYAFCTPNTNSAGSQNNGSSGGN